MYSLRGTTCLKANETNVWGLVLAQNGVNEHPSS